MQESPSLTQKIKDLNDSLRNLEPLIKSDPGFCIEKTIEYFKEGIPGILRNSPSAFWHNFTLARRAARHIFSILAFIDSFSTDLDLLLADKIFQNIAISTELWEGVIAKQHELAAFASYMLDVPAEQRPAVEQSIIALSDILVKTVPSNPEQIKGLLTHTSTLLNSKTNDSARELALQALNNMITNQDLWEIIKSNRENIAILIVGALKLSTSTFTKATPLVSNLIALVAENIQTVDPNLIHTMMKSTHVLLHEKMTHFFTLCDAGINFVEQSNFLTTLQIHKEAIEEMIAHYIPREIVEKTGITSKAITTILLNRKALDVFKRAYMSYSRDTNHSVGLIKAVAIIITNPTILKLLVRTTIHVTRRAMVSTTKEIIFSPKTFVVWLMKFVPDFMRRTHAEKIVNDILKKRPPTQPGQKQDLSALCKQEKSRDPIVIHTLKGYFKGLRIKYDLRKFKINSFDFQGATFGEKGNTFSLAKSKISKTDFTGAIFKTDKIDLSKMEIDTSSFLTLLPSLKGKQIIYKKGEKGIKIISATKDLPLLRQRIKSAGLEGISIEFAEPPKSFVATLKAAREQSRDKTQQHLIST